MEFIDDNIIIECHQPHPLKDESHPALIMFLHALLSIWQSFRSDGGGYSNSVASTSPAVFQHSTPASTIFYFSF